MLCTHTCQLLKLNKHCQGSSGFCNTESSRRIQGLCNNKEDDVIHCFCCFFYSELKCFTFEEYNQRAGGSRTKTATQRGRRTRVCSHHTAFSLLRGSDTPINGPAQEASLLYYCLPFVHCTLSLNCKSGLGRVTCNRPE